MDFRRVLQKIRVPLGFLFSIAFLVFAKPEPLMLAIGGMIALVGLALRAWASGHIRKNAELAISGPYAYTRNPLYLGSFLLCVGFILCSGKWWLSAIFGIVFLVVYFPVMQAEAKELIEIFGEKYEHYSRHVYMFFPRLTPFPESSKAAFDVSLYMRYREYRAALGLAFAWSILAIKAYFGI